MFFAVWRIAVWLSLQPPLLRPKYAHLAGATQVPARQWLCTTIGLDRSDQGSRALRLKHLAQSSYQSVVRCVYSANQCLHLRRAHEFDPMKVAVQAFLHAIAPSCALYRAALPKHVERAWGCANLFWRACRDQDPQSSLLDCLPCEFHPPLREFHRVFQEFRRDLRSARESRGLYRQR